MTTRIFASGFAAALLLVAAAAYAQEDRIAFPIAELGNCSSKAECKVYCDIPGNIPQCISFAEANGLMSREEATMAKKIIDTEGPGGCKGAECRTYCEDAAVADECLSFAEKHDLISKEDLERAKKLAGKPGPGGCRGIECKQYCEDPAHKEECISFAVANGFMTEEEAGRVRKFENVEGPGGCRGEECRSYCEAEEHRDECLNFAKENGLMNEADIERAKKAFGKPGPGGCRGEECRMYCADPAHQEECTRFAVENGFMTEEEAGRARNLIDRPGPGGCQGEECRSYCEDASHREECVAFAIENGFISADEAEHVRAAGDLVGPGGCKGEECKTYCEDPTNREACSKFGKQHERSGQSGRLPPRGFEDRAGKPGAGGCTTPEECGKVCGENPDLCRGGRFEGSGHEWRDRGAPPCSSDSECRQLEEECRANPESCRTRFQGRDSPEYLNMSESERRTRTNDHERSNRSSGSWETKPYRPEGLLPVEAFRRKPNESKVAEPQASGEGASEEQRRVYEMNLERFRQFQESSEFTEEERFRREVESRGVPAQGGGMQPPEFQAPPDAYPKEELAPQFEAPQSRRAPLDLVAASAAVISRLFGVQLR